MSEPSPIYNSVPQGSVLGPVSLSIYTMPLEEGILRHGLQNVMYADKIQLHVTCDGNQVQTRTIEECVGEISKLDEDKYIVLE